MKKSKWKILNLIIKHCGLCPYERYGELWIYRCKQTGSIIEDDNRFKNILENCPLKNYRRRN